MATYITGSSNYPADFDLSPTGTGVSATVTFALDEIRDGNGVVTQSGDTIAGRDVNVVYTILNKMERTIGINPQGNYSNVTDRLNYIETSGQGAYLHLSGGNVFGPVNFITGSTLTLSSMVSTGLTWTTYGATTINGSGSINISTTGNASLSASNITASGVSITSNSNNTFINAISSVRISGSSNIQLATTGNSVIMSSGLTSVSATIAPSTGLVDLGSTGSYFNILYVNQIISTGATSLGESFVSKSGSDIFGNLNFTGNASIILNTGSSITNMGSGINDLGSVGNPFYGIYTKNLFATNITGLSPVTFLSDIRFASNLSIGASGTGITIGSAGNPVDTIYATTIVGATGLDVNALVTKSGSDYFGTLTFSGNATLVLNSGSNITTNTSGIGNIGTAALPFGNVYSSGINGRAQGTMVFNEQLTGAVTGNNKTFAMANTPVNNFAMIFVSGIYIRPAVDYTFSGNYIILTGTFSAPATSPYAGFYVY